MLKFSDIFIQVTTDGKWIVGEHTDYPAKKVYIAGGFCGCGFKYALTVGKLIAQKIAGENPTLLGGSHVDMMKDWSPNRIVSKEQHEDDDKP
jgi:glycine/D-amino acid oxidase-like deaminating enzyme